MKIEWQKIANIFIVFIVELCKYLCYYLKNLNFTRGMSFGMPFYDLSCPRCDKEYNIMASMKDKMEKRIPCPDCGSFDLITVYSGAPAYIKAASAPACPNSHVCGAGCRHAS